VLKIATAKLASAASVENVANVAILIEDAI
jgi:hypothetical protein